MIIIDSPTTFIKGSNAILTANFHTDNRVNSIWFSVPIEYLNYLCTERSDAFVVSLIVFAMSKGEDITCRTAISEKLYMSLTLYLIPFLCKINPNLKYIYIYCQTDHTLLFNEDKVGTGMSCGVDSLSTTIYHGKKAGSNKYQINLLTLFNSGYYGSDDELGNNFKKYINQSKEFCQKFGYPLLLVDSNVSKYSVYSFIESHTYLTCSVVLALQKLFSTYYYSSGYDIYSFKACFDDSAYYDQFLLESISTENVRFVSANSIMSRVEKIELLNRHPEYLRHLYVCTSGNPPFNCGKCEKCIRTLLAIDSIDALCNISNSFDINLFISKRNFYISLMLVKKNTNIYYKEIYERYKLNNKKIPLLAYLFVPIFTLFIRLRPILTKVLGKRFINLIKKVRGSI